MPFSNPVALAALASLIPIILLYLLKPKPIVVRIPSLIFITYIEKKKSRLSARLKKLIRDPILLLQLLVLIFLALAAAAPFYFAQETIGSGHTVLILDVSASMQSGGGFDEMIKKADRYVTRRNTIILAENNALTALEKGSMSNAKNVLSKLKPRATTTDLSSAMLLGRSMITEDNGKIVVISDFVNSGDTDPRDTKSLIESDGIPVDFVKVGGKDISNIAIVDGNIVRVNGIYSYTATIENFYTTSKNVVVNVYHNDKKTGQETLTIQGNSQDYLALNNLQGGVTRIEITNKDDLSVDNNAYISIPKNSRRNVLYVSDVKKSPAVSALKVLEDVGISLEQVSSSGFSPSNQYAVVVVGTITPDAGQMKAGSATDESFKKLADYAAAGGSVIIMGSSNLTKVSTYGVLPVEIKGLLANGTLEASYSPIIKNINIEAMKVSQYLDVTEKPKATTIVYARAEDGDKDKNISASASTRVPVLTYWSYGGGTIVYMGMNDLTTSMIPEYPLFWMQLIDWLSGVGGYEEYNVKTGSTMPFTSSRDVKTPSGFDVNTKTALFDEVGIYRIGDMDIAANLYDRTESSLVDTTTIQSMDTISGTDTANAELVDVKKLLSDYLLILAILLVCFEVYMLKQRGEFK